jgi:hypothetical protein
MNEGFFDSTPHSLGVRRKAMCAMAAGKDFQNTNSVLK